MGKELSTVHRGEYLGEGLCIRTHPDGYCTQGNGKLYKIWSHRHSGASCYWIENPDRIDYLIQSGMSPEFMADRFEKPALKKAVVHPGLPPECWIEKDSRNAGVDFAAITRLIAEAKPGVK